MTPQPREEIRTALAANEPYAALRVLRAAFAWAASAADRAREDPDEAAAVEAVILLDDALTEGRRVASAIPPLLDAAELGPSVEEYLRQRARELTELGEHLESAHRAHEKLAESESELRQRLADHADLHARIGDLRRLERLVRALDELEPQRRLLDARVDALAAAAGDTEQSIEQQGRELLQFTERALSALEPRTRELAERLTAAESALAAEEDRLARDELALAAAVERTERLRQTHEERAAALAAHARADRELAATLTALADLPPGPERTAVERARIMLDEVEARLGELDGVLRDALARLHEAGQREHAVIGWADSAPGPELS